MNKLTEAPHKSKRVRLKRRRTRQEILMAAQKLMTDNGVETLTLESVAGELGLTKQALYHYFPSKEALVGSLVATLLEDEIESITEAIMETGDDTLVLGTMIRAFYHHHINRLEAFRTVYCRTQLYPSKVMGFDKGMLEEDINPRTRNLFDTLEQRLTDDSMSDTERTRMRQLAFVAWLSALGLVTMLGIADATSDPLIHKDEDLLETLTKVFNSAL
jgi:AcrR family transcriptional regulator